MTKLNVTNKRMKNVETTEKAIKFQTLRYIDKTNNCFIVLFRYFILSACSSADAITFFLSPRLRHEHTIRIEMSECECE